MKKVQEIVMVSALVLALATNAFAQTNLQFTAASATDERAIRLTWASQSNEVYEIDEADALIDTNTGSITWNKLYDDYPSQGTNTFWLDTGNYNLVPPILHPKNSPMRFYRIVDQGPDNLISDEPTVSIVSPTNGALVSGELIITVSAYTDQPEFSTKLYVDGQEMSFADSQTNYISNSTNYSTITYSINTCEWGNGTHTLFATVESSSAPGGGPIGSPAALVGHAVSQFVPVIFSNLVTRISFSQPFFNPDAGQTQQVSAVFAANSDWTLNIVDISSNIVKTVTGSGTSMQFNWDGSDNNNLPVPAGVYYYYISAATNGGSSNLESGGPLQPDFAFSSSISPETSELWAVAPNSESVVPLALYPPGFDTNGFTIFSATPSEVASLTASSSSAELDMPTDSGGSFSTDASGGGSSAASQDSPATPQRPPTAPMARVAGTFGIGFQTYSANGTNGYSLIGPLNGLYLLRVYIQGPSGPTTQAIPYPPLTGVDTEAINFGLQMEKGGWAPGLTKPNDKLQISDLRYSSTPFNQVNLALLLLHGNYGTSQDFNANGCKQMYFPIAYGTSAQYLRMSEMNLGGAGTNGLKWIAIAACHSLYHANWQNMQSLGVYPYNGNLHLILGADTDMSTDANLGAYWAKDMLFGSSTNYNPMTIRNAWYEAAGRAYVYAAQHGATLGTIKLAVAGDSNCQGDYLQTNYPPTGSWFYETQQVYP